MDRLVEEDEQAQRSRPLDRLAARCARLRARCGGIADTVEALNERRVQMLLLDPRFEQAANAAPPAASWPSMTAALPVRRLSLQPVAHLREAVVEAALVQDADVLVIRHHPELAPFSGIGALLRF